jgi:hypothetical protein
MKRPRYLHCIVGVVAVVALSLAMGLATAGAATTGGHATKVTPTSFTDPTGDQAGPASDITTLVLGDDYATGTMTFTLTAVGYGSMSADSNPLVKVYLDTDKNPSTGSANQGGTEYALAAARDALGSGWWIQKWDAASGKYVMPAQSATMSFTRSGDVLTWTVNRTDITVTTGLTLNVWSSTWDSSDNQTGEDVAPDDGMWSYDLATPPPPPPPAPPAPAPVIKPMIAAPVATPKAPVAGKQFAIVFPVTRSDTGAPLTQGTMVCDPSVAGKVLPHRETFKAGKARLSFAVPRGAKGKSLKVKVTITAGTKSATKVATFRIR